MEHPKHHSCIVGISGGSGSGKTVFAQALVGQLGSDRALLLSQDAYYRDLSHVPPSGREGFNFDHPDALETPLLAQHLDALKSGLSVDVPVYDFQSHTRTLQTVRKHPRPVILVEGILVLAETELFRRLDLAVFVDAPPDVRLFRRMTRDVQQRGRTSESVFRQYMNTVRPMHEAFVEPSRKRADLIVPGQGDTGVAQALILGHLRPLSDL